MLALVGPFADPLLDMSALFGKLDSMEPPLRPLCQEL